MKPKKIISIIAALVAILLLAAWPLTLSAFNQQDPTLVDPVVFASYTASYSVNTQGTLLASETIVASFPDYSHHGIFRFWDLKQPGYPSHRLTPTVISTWVDGYPAYNSVYMQKDQRYLVDKIGDPQQTLDAGLHTYHIIYTIPDALIATPSGSGSEFQWLVVSPGWSNAMLSSNVTLHLPGVLGPISCKILDTRNSGCAVTKNGNGSVTIKTRYIPSKTGVVVNVPLSIKLPALHNPPLPWSVTFDPILGKNKALLLVTLLLTLLSVPTALRIRKKLLQPKLPTPIMVAPPEGLGPIQTVFAETGSVGSNALISTILYLASKKLVKLDEVDPNSWSITRVGDETAWDKLDPISATLQDSLGLKKSNDVFNADGRESSGQTLQTATSKLAEKAGTWADEQALFEPNKGIGVAQLLWGVSSLATLLLFVTPMLPSTAVATIFVLPFALFATTLSGVTSASAAHRRTARGTELASQAAGFHRILSTTSSEERFDFSARKDIFIDYIPYAVAYDIAEGWANKYQTTTGQTPPIPFWYPYNAALATNMLLYSSGAGFPSFNNSISSSISSYSSSITSSSIGSIGGGGFSGGGGGGGGSW